MFDSVGRVILEVMNPKMRTLSVFVLDFVSVFLWQASHLKGDIRRRAVGDESWMRIYLSKPVGRWASKAAITNPTRDHHRH